MIQNSLKPSEINSLKQIHAIPSFCLEKNVKFLSHKPISMKEFVVNIGAASKACNASDEEVKSYVVKMLDKHGGNL